MNPTFRPWQRPAEKLILLILFRTHWNHVNHHFWFKAPMVASSWLCNFLVQAIKLTGLEVPLTDGPLTVAWTCRVNFLETQPTRNLCHLEISPTFNSGSEFSGLFQGLSWELEQADLRAFALPQVLMPTNDAFAALGNGVITLHGPWRPTWRSCDRCVAKLKLRIGDFSVDSNRFKKCFQHTFVSVLQSLFGEEKLRTSEQRVRT